MRNLTTVFLVSVFCVAAQATLDESALNDPHPGTIDRQRIPPPIAERMQVTIEILNMRLMDQTFHEQLRRNPGKDLKEFDLSAVKDRRLVKQYSIDIMFPEKDESTISDGVYALQLTLDSKKKSTHQVLRTLVNKQYFIRTKIEVLCQIIADKAERFEKVECPASIQVSLRPLPTVSPDLVGRFRFDWKSFFDDRFPMVSWDGFLNFKANLDRDYLIQK